MALIRAVSAALALAPLVLGCGPKQVPLTADFPTPVLARHDYAVALHLAPGFRTAVAEESLPDGSEWRVELGPAQRRLFLQVFEGVFTRTTEVDGPAPAAAAGLARPELVSYQISTPELNKSEYYEAWLHYRVRLLDRDGNETAVLPIKAYGRSSDRLFDDAAALHQATEAAMRDAAAVLTSRLRDVTLIQDWLAEEPGEAGR